MYPKLPISFCFVYPYRYAMTPASYSTSMSALNSNERRNIEALLAARVAVILFCWRVEYCLCGGVIVGHAATVVSRGRGLGQCALSTESKFGVTTKRCASEKIIMWHRRARFSERVAGKDCVDLFKIIQKSFQVYATFVLLNLIS